MADLKTILDGYAADLFVFNEMMTQAGALKMMTRNQAEQVNTIVRPRLPCHVRIDMRSPKGVVHIAIAASPIEIVSLDHRSRIV